ncbi:MAG: phage tail protein [Alistipes sp.]|jgi:microcystin-dependent protein|nr:phage tail protein [Alistipes sp.]
MKQTVARALLQPNKNFPIDCETLDSLQKNTAVVQILGNIVGDKAILYGCALESNNTKRGAGYVFLRTKDYPQGEVVYWEGGNVSGGMYLHQENVAVTAQGYDFPQAYTERSLRPGVGNENYSWDGFKVYKTPGQLEQDVATINIALAKLTPAPLGIVQMWAGSSVPSGYELCEGQQLRIADYPELYAALGATFNTAPNYAGTAQTTTSGYFRLPDLRGRFIAGYSTVDGEYNRYGRAGGAKTVAITTSQMPSHTHNVNDYYYIEHNGAVSWGISGKEVAGSNLQGSHSSDSDNNTLLYKTHATTSAGSGLAHENRPPYYVLAFIMKTKN